MLQGEKTAVQQPGTSSSSCTLMAVNYTYFNEFWKSLMFQPNASVIKSE